ncbi:MAG: uracil-DNA glycosylase [Planctomycetota bacterium]|nr:MAG: uracil-DNA glycosylase [Planctomycetota bacterium]
MNPDELRAELAALARQAQGLADLDRLLGVRDTPVPPLPPLRAAFAPPRSPSVAAPANRARDATPASPKALPKEPRPARGLSLAEREARLHTLADRMAGCTRCRLHEGRTRLVFGQGAADADLVFVGEGPGYHEDQQGLAFVGRAGELLTKMIAALGLSRDEVFICNVVKCRPPGNRNPQPDEMGTCLPYLREQLDIVQPRVICALGKTAAVGLGLITPDQSLGRNRGLHDWHGTPALVTYHPAYLLRSPSEKRKAWHDLQQLFPYIGGRPGREAGSARA